MWIIIEIKKLKIDQKTNLKNIHHSKNSKDSQLSANVTWHDAYSPVETKKYSKKNPNWIIRCNIYINEEDGVINLESKSSYPQNI